ncbi:MAG TPA: glucokinase [Gillisia sp.]|nr:glucokinase [Gillisia sp.]
MEQSISLIFDEGDPSHIPFSAGKTGFKEGIILAGDIGGTKTNLSIYKLEGSRLNPLLENTFTTRNFSSFNAILNLFIEAEIKLSEIDCICLGVAGPVIDGKVSGTNFPWVLSEEEIRKTTGISRVYLINDMEANAYGLGVLKKDERIEIKKGAHPAGNKALISPGTGLGEAGIYWDGTYFHPFATEGGHCDFSPRNEQDIALYKFLQNLFGHVSWERIISGPGIYTLYQFLLKEKNEEEPAWFCEKLEEKSLAAVISESALEGNYPLSNETMQLFFRYLAIETSQIALKFKATGGIYIGGGILPKVLDLLDKETFVDNFLQVNRMNPLLETIPIYLITNVDSPMYGAAFYAALRLSERK